MVHKNILISGKVQGVGYRFFIQRIAQQLLVNGFIKNFPDGRVYIEAESEEEIMNEFIRNCKNGPKYAFVENMEINDDQIKNMHGFEIRF
ncbi:acylphosphatase [Bacteroidota bacterium]